MAEEKTLDMEGIEEDAEKARQLEEEAKAGPDRGSYTHVFKTPFQWKGKSYESLSFDWKSLKGADYTAIEDEIVMRGRTLISAAFTGRFLAGMAARACTERDENGKRVIDTKAIEEMSLIDFKAIRGEAQGFLLRAE